MSILTLEEGTTYQNSDNAQDKYNCYAKRLHEEDNINANGFFFGQ